MKKYMFFIYTRFKERTAYSSRYLIFIISSYIEMISILSIWMAVFKNSKHDIGGYNQKEMILYLMLSFSLLSIIRQGVANRVSHDIATGDIVSYFLKPISYVNKLIFESISDILFNSIYLLPPLIIGILYLDILKFNFIRLVVFLLSLFLGAMIYFLIDFMIGLFAFFVNYIWGLLLVKEVLFRFFSGELFPLSFLPKKIEKFFLLLPFNSMTYKPILIIFGRVENRELIHTLLLQIFWVALLSIITKIIWKRANKRLSINGG